MSHRRSPQPWFFARPSGGRRSWFALVVLTAVVAASGTSFETVGRAQPAVVPAAEDPYPNFDIRMLRRGSRVKATAADLEFLARFAPDAAAAARQLASREASVAAIQTAHPGARVEVEPGLGTVEAVTARPGLVFLTAASDDRVETLRSFLFRHAAAYGVTGAQVAEFAVVADYVNPAGNMGWAEFEQRFHGIPVFQGLLRGGFTAKGELVRTTGVLATNIDPASLATSPSLSASEAVSIAAKNVGWDVEAPTLVPATSADSNHVRFDRGSMAQPPTAWLVYFPLADGVVRLAWAAQIIGDPYGFLTVVDGETGTVLFRKNLTSFQSQPATYRVYPPDGIASASPSPALPGSGYQAPYASRQTVTLVGNEPPNTFNSLGWMTDGTFQTSGNNVRAGLDLVAPDGIDAIVQSGNRVFDFPYDPATQPPSGPDYRSGEVTDMFFWTNRYHDELYRLGFTEAARNFQVDNFGRGGAGSDQVNAEAQDYSGTNNAEFLAPVDGTPGRMQMFLFTAPTPHRTSTLDHRVLFHELTHGTAFRLHNNVSGLVSQMSLGMGEGWCDFYAHALLSEPSDPVNGVYPFADWVAYLLRPGFTDNAYYGYRRFPYAALSATGGPQNRPHNPLTLADISPVHADLSDGAYPPAFTSDPTATHQVGEVWASALFEVRALFIARLGHVTGNTRILQFVTDGMKLNVVNPTLVSGRDAILSAAYGGGATQSDIDDIWAGFAARGLGVGARINDASSFDVTEAFDLPGLAPAGTTIVAEGVPNGRIEPGEEVSVSFCMTNTSTAPTGELTATLLSGYGVGMPSAPQLFGALAPGDTACRTYTFTAVGGCGMTMVAWLRTESTTGSPINLHYPMLLGVNARVFWEDFDAVTLPALPPGWSTGTLAGTQNLFRTVAYGPLPNVSRVFVDAPGSISDNYLDSPPIAIPAGPPALLTFRQDHQLEPHYDGAVLEISVGGGAFLDIRTAGGSFVTGGYTGVLEPGTNPLARRPAWHGGSEFNFLTQILLPADASGQTIRLRWRLGTDHAGGHNGWGIDAVAVTVPSCSIGVPTGVDDAYTTPMNTALVVPAPGVMSNDTTNGGGSMTVALVNTASHGTVDLSPHGGFTYTPAPGFTGADSFTYRATNIVGQGNLATARVSVAGAVGPQPPLNLRAASIVGNTVTLRWDPPTSGPAPLYYTLEGGVVPGQVLASLPTGSAATSYTFQAPTGSFYVRMINMAGTPSAPSNEIQIHVNVPVAPSAPANLLGLAENANLTLAWANTFEGGAPASLLLEVNGSLALALPVPVSEGFSFAGVPPGTYTLSVRAVNAGGISPSSNPVTLTFPGTCAGPPQPPANFRAYRTDNVVFVEWGLPPAGPAPAAYHLQVGGSLALGIPTTARALSGAVPPGSYQLSVRASNACGVGAATPAQVVTVP